MKSPQSAGRQILKLAFQKLDLPLRLRILTLHRKNARLRLRIFCLQCRNARKQCCVLILRFQLWLVRVAYNLNK